MEGVKAPSILVYYQDCFDIINTIGAVNYLIFELKIIVARL